MTIKATNLSTPSERETLEVDILFVGAGPANLSAAIHLAKLCQKQGKELPNIAVIEKALEVGAHQISGAVLNPSALQTLFPNYLELNCPLESKVTSEEFRFLTRNRSFKSPILPPQMHNHGNYVTSLSKLTRWLGKQAEELGINVFTGFTGTEILFDGSRVIGVSTGDRGINAKMEKKPNFEAGVNIKAKCTVFGEGVRGFLTKSLIPKLGLEGRNPQTFETGVKEVWECPKGRFEPGYVMHTMGYPLDRKTVGGSFVYGMKDDLLVIGLVVSLNYSDPFMEPYKELQKLKQHPAISKFIEGGKQIAYGAKAIASGGYYAIPKLYFDGGLITGESGALLDMSRLKGIHTGMWSGIFAAQTLMENLIQNSGFTSESLAPYQKHLLESQVGQDLCKARNFHQALSTGLPKAFLHLGIQQITAGRGLIDPMPTQIDREHYETIAKAHGNATAQIPELHSKDFVVDKLTSV
ncbi:MAG: NAD(P)/FAD-dependent oxidoreductase, partial [Bdellovibrionales bacterium]|nr:NAD(P)/FAD-dependent oxidoreductase [Bdellovibrionales bacterium]